MTSGVEQEIEPILGVPAGPRGPRREVGAVARGAWFGLCTQAVDKVLPIVILLYLARTLAPEEFGVYSFVIAYLAFFQIVSDYSVDTVLVREMSREKGAQREAILRAGLGLKLSIAFSLAALSVLVAGPISGGRVPLSLMLVASVSLPTTLGGAFRAYFRAELNIRAVFSIAVGRACLLAAGVIIAVASGSGLLGIFASMAVANLLTGLSVAVFLSRRLDPRPSLDRATWARLIRGVLPLLGTAMAVTVSLRAGHLMLMTMRGPVEVGLLGAASRVSEAFTLLPDALMIAILPLMAGRHGADGEDAEGALRAGMRAARYLVAVTGVPVLICAVEGARVMTVLFGEAFAVAGPALTVLGFTALFSATGTVIINLLVAAQRVQTLYRNTVAFALVNLCLAALLIHHYAELGAAVAVLATSVGSQISLSMLPSTRAYVRPLLAAASRAFAAVLIAASAGFVCELGALGNVAAALSVYLAGLALLGVVDRSDLHFLLTVFGARDRLG